MSSHFLTFLFLIFLISCGESGSGGSSGSSSETDGISQNETIRVDGSNIQGIYSAEMWPVNHNLHLKKVGTATLERKGDTLTAVVKMDHAPKLMTIRQAVYTGRRCPNIGDDINKDAYIDIQEARAAIGYVTVPLDGDLDSQSAGYYFNPLSSSQGHYLYKVTGSVTRLFDDLHEVETNFSDDITKLEANDGLTFPGRVVLFQGLSYDVTLPPTVGGQEGRGAHESLPVACGILWKE